MKLLFIMITVFSLVPIRASAQQTLNKSMTHNGVLREYIVYIPAIYNPNTPAPLVFNFHGYTMTAKAQMNWGGNMRPVADTAGFILVYPQGTLLGDATHWNVGSWTAASKADDIGFTEAMIDTLSSNYNIDSDRVYSCGYSNGGYFSYELACQLSERIAAIASVAGTMSTKTYAACNASHPTPVLSIHGTADGTVSYYGGDPIRSESQSRVNEYWAAHNHISDPPLVSSLPDINPSDGSTVELSLYEDEDACAAVAHYKVIGGGHDWPGAWGNRDINASRIIWEFVSKYNLKGLMECRVSSFQGEVAGKGNTSLYPNPFQSRVTLETNADEIREYHIYSSLGSLVSEGTIGPEAKIIELSDLPVDVYVLEIGGETIKLLKTK
jgi:polyhydroxybutyrate depolymerase